MVDPIFISNLTLFSFAALSLIVYIYLRKQIIKKDLKLSTSSSKITKELQEFYDYENSAINFRKGSWNIHALKNLPRQELEDFFHETTLSDAKILLKQVDPPSQALVFSKLELHPSVKRCLSS